MVRILVLTIAFIAILTMDVHCHQKNWKESEASAQAPHGSKRFNKSAPVMLYNPITKQMEERQRIFERYSGQHEGSYTPMSHNPTPHQLQGWQPGQSEVSSSETPILEDIAHFPQNMPSKKRYRVWTDEYFESVMEHRKKNNLTLTEAADRHKMPRTTLCNYIKRVSSKKKEAESSQAPHPKRKRTWLSFNLNTNDISEAPMTANFEYERGTPIRTTGSDSRLQTFEQHPTFNPGHISLERGNNVRKKPLMREPDLSFPASDRGKGVELSRMPTRFGIPAQSLDIPPRKGVELSRMPVRFGLPIQSPDIPPRNSETPLVHSPQYNEGDYEVIRSLYNEK